MRTVFCAVILGPSGADAGLSRHHRGGGSLRDLAHPFQTGVERALAARDRVPDPGDSGSRAPSVHSPCSVPTRGLETHRPVRRHRSRRRAVDLFLRARTHDGRGPAGCPAGAGPALPERGGNFLCSFLLCIPDDRSDAHGCRPPVVGLVGNPRGPLRLPDGDPESGPGARRGPHGRIADRVLHSPRPGGDEVRRRNLETRRVGWSRFTVTPTTADETSFARLPELTRQLEATTKRLEKRALPPALPRSGPRDEVP